MLTGALALAAVLAGAAGAWSPCGFSIVETLRWPRTARASVNARAWFVAGALVGGAATFTALAWLGGPVRLAPAGAAIAFLAALAEARGVRVVPQVRRQVPEPWRRRLPLPVAAGLYGVLLGLGFLTFVLTLAFWALAAVDVALGNVRIGLALGLAFGAGRAVPLIALAALPRSERLHGERPGLLRALRLANALVLAVCGALLVAAGSAAAVFVRGGVDPTASAEGVAWDGAGAGILFQGPGTALRLDGTDPALGGSLLAWRTASLVSVVRAADFSPVVELRLAGADALAVSDRWLAYRTHAVGRDAIAVRRLDAPERARVIATARAPEQLSRPSLDGDLLAFAVAGPAASRIVVADLRGGPLHTVRSARLELLTSPSVLGGSLLYVRESSTSQRLLLGRVFGGPEKTLFERNQLGLRDSGHEPGYSEVTQTPKPKPPARFVFGSTALAPTHAYLTLLPQNGDRRRAEILRIPR